MQWNRSAGSKTLTRLLPADVAERYRRRFDDARRLNNTLKEVEALSIDTVERDRRTLS